MVPSTDSPFCPAWSGSMACSYTCCYLRAIIFFRKIWRESGCLTCRKQLIAHEAPYRPGEIQPSCCCQRPEKATPSCHGMLGDTVDWQDLTFFPLGLWFIQYVSFCPGLQHGRAHAFDPRVDLGSSGLASPNPLLLNYTHVVDGNSTAAIRCGSRRHDRLHAGAKPGRLLDCRR